MYGGTLGQHALLVAEGPDLLALTLSRALYLFRLSDGTLLGQAAHHSASILDLHLSPNGQALVAIDQTASVSRF
jgi:hypothetical protein